MKTSAEVDASTSWGTALERCRRQLKFLQEIVRATASGSSRNHLLHAIVDQATEATASEVCSIYLWNADERVLVLAATNGLSSRYVGEVKLALGEGVTGWVAAQRAPLAVRDVRYDPRFSWVAGFDQPAYISMLSVPILSADRLLGVINLQTAEARQFSAEDTDFVGALAAEIASIVELADVHESLGLQLAHERRAASLASRLSGGRAEQLQALLTDFLTPTIDAQRQLARLEQLVPEQERTIVAEARGLLLAMRDRIDGLALWLEGDGAARW